MPVSMARQGGQVQIEQSNMRLSLNKAKMVKGGFSCTVIKETQYLIKKPCADVREQKKWGVVLPHHQKVKAAIERHPAIVHENLTDGCLSCRNGAVKNPLTRGRCNRRGAPPPQPTPSAPRI